MNELKDALYIVFDENEYIQQQLESAVTEGIDEKQVIESLTQSIHESIETLARPSDHIGNQLLKEISKSINFDLVKGYVFNYYEEYE